MRAIYAMGLGALSYGASLADFAVLRSLPAHGPGGRPTYGKTLPGNYPIPREEPQRAAFPSRQTFRRAHLKWSKRYGPRKSARSAASSNARPEGSARRSQAGGRPRPALEGQQK